MWVKVSIAALVIALLGGAMYYLDNEEALTKAGGLHNAERPQTESLP